MDFSHEVDVNTKRHHIRGSYDDAFLQTMSTNGHIYKIIIDKFTDRFIAEHYAELVDKLDIDYIRKSVSEQLTGIIADKLITKE